MNLFLKILSVATTGAFFSFMAHAQSSDTKFAVISDVHVMDPSLIVNDGEAFAEYLKHDRKMLKESPALLEKLTNNLLAEKPSFVLVTGDLTKDGEEVSHNYLVEHCLQRLKNAGITALVIPGNHDVNNPHAVCFNDTVTTRVKTVTPQEFAQIYTDFGYGNAIARDTSSLSYVYQITPQLRILALDACKYELNDFNKNICRHDGRLKPETIKFIKAQMSDAKSKGIRVIGMMHHGFIEHWKYQNKVIPGYVVDDWEKIRKTFANIGLEVIFTGHSHAQDIAYKKGIYDIETGSAVSYPSPYRIASLRGDSLCIRSYNIDSIDYPTDSMDFQQYARIHTGEGFKSIASAMIPEKVPSELRNTALDIVADAFCDNYRGDELLTDERKKVINGIGGSLRKYSFKLSLIFKKVTKSLLSDQAPADNNTIIILSR